MRLRPVVLLATVLSCSAWGQTYTIWTFAGGALPVNVPGTSARLGAAPQSLAADRAGNVFFVVQNTVLRLDATTGVLTLVAGNGSMGFSGDNGPATSAQLNNPRGVAVDSAGNLYIADLGNVRIRKVSNGVITTVAGGGSSAFFDTGPATSAQLWGPAGIAVDSNGNLYFADDAYFGYNLIRKDLGSPTLTSILVNAGHGSGGTGRVYIWSPPLKFGAVGVILQRYSDRGACELREEYGAPTLPEKRATLRLSPAGALRVLPRAAPLPVTL